jgi:hypothetical protein
MTDMTDRPYRNDQEVEEPTKAAELKIDLQPDAGFIYIRLDEETVS